jgi:hypothetical protein
MYVLYNADEQKYARHKGYTTLISHAKIYRRLPKGDLPKGWAYTAVELTRKHILDSVRSTLLKQFPYGIPTPPRR